MAEMGACCGNFPANSFMMSGARWRAALALSILEAHDIVHPASFGPKTLQSFATEDGNKHEHTKPMMETGQHAALRGPPSQTNNGRDSGRRNRVPLNPPPLLTRQVGTKLSAKPRGILARKQSR